jgi:hypothetical protein
MKHVSAMEQVRNLALWFGQYQVMNALQDNGLVSDNCITLNEVFIDDIKNAMSEENYTRVYESLRKQKKTTKGE